MSDADVASWTIWSLKSMIAMCNIALDAADPQEVMDEYFNEAGEDQTENVEWAMAMWKTLRTKNAFELEQVRSRARAELQLVLEESR